jgi:hypothetical protein
MMYLSLQHGFMMNVSTDTNTTTDSTNQLIRTVDNGRAVEFEEGVWENAEFIDYDSGYPIYVRRTF